MSRLIYPENEPEVDLFGDPLPTYDDWCDDEGDTEEWQPVDMPPDLHEEMYERSLFSE